MIGFSATRVWSSLGLPQEVTDVYVDNSEVLRQFRGFLFVRIVPILRDIGLWGDKVQQAFADMGVLTFADADIDAAMAEDGTQPATSSMPSWPASSRWPPRPD